MAGIQDQLNSLPQIGRVEWIGLSVEPRSGIRTAGSVRARVGTGLDGDHHSTHRPGGNRQVTLIQGEHLPVVAALTGRDRVGPEQLRRNIVVSGINLAALKQRRFRVGGAVLEGTGECAPCSRMEANLGPGGFNAMRGHGGITARVIEEGTIALGDEVALMPDEEC